MKKTAKISLYVLLALACLFSLYLNGKMLLVNYTNQLYQKGAADAQKQLIDSIIKSAQSDQEIKVTNDKTTVTLVDKEKYARPKTK